MHARGSYSTRPREDVGLKSQWRVVREEKRIASASSRLTGSMALSKAKEVLINASGFRG